MQNRLDPAESIVELGGIVEGKDTMWQPELACHSLDRLSSTTGQDRS